MASQKILVVDDSLSQRLVLQALLAQEGHQVIMASDGAEAVVKAKSELPDLIIMDIVMPGLNGFQATRLLTQGAGTRHIPVVMVSNKDQQADRVWGARQGARGYVTKPVRERELITLIESLIP